MLFDIRYDDVKVIKAIRAKALANATSGVVITNWSGEGQTYSGQVVADTETVLRETLRFLDEYYGNRITQTSPNFNC